MRVTFSGSDKLLASGNHQGDVFLWELLDNQKSYEPALNAKLIRVIRFPCDTGICGLAIVSDTRLITSTDCETAIWNVDTGERIHKVNESYSFHTLRFNPSFPECLVTEKGVIGLDYDPSRPSKLRMTNSSLYSITPEINPTGDSWITWNGKKVICLPSHSHLTGIVTAWCTWGHTVAVAYYSGNIQLFKFKEDATF